MAKAKKTLSLLMAALMLVFTCVSYVPAKAAENTASKPEVTFVGVDHSPLVVGDTETFSFVTANADQVKYNVVLKDAAGKVVEEVTKGDTAAVAGNAPYVVKASTVFALGKYTLSVKATRVSDSAVATYDAALNCVTRDDANRIYANGAVDMEKTEYVLGDKVVVNGVKDLAGIAGPYKYRLHVYNPATGWTKNVVANYGDKLEWTPSAAGTYVLDIHINSEKSTTWAKYLANPTSTDVYGTYEAWKLQTITVTDTLKATDVKATNKKTVKVTFNKDLGTVTPANFSIAQKDDQYTIVPVEKVSVDKNVVTLTTSEDLEDGTSYVVTTTNVASADGKLTLATSANEFKYVEVTTPASIAFKATKVAVDDTIGLVIKDKDGNDITANFDLANDITVDTDNDNVVYEDGVITAAAAGHTIVNVSINDTDVETGNTIITIVDTTQVLTSLGAATIVDGDAEADFDEPTMTVYNEDDHAYVMQVQTLDQDGDDIVATDDSELTVTYKSLNTGVVIVDATTGEVTPVKTGTASVYVKAEFKNKTVSKTYTVEVKAAREATSLKLDKTSVKLVGGSGIDSTVKVNVLDQFGNKLALDGGEWTVEITKGDAYIGNLANDVNEDSVKQYDITLSPLEATDKAGSATVSVKYVDGDTTLKATIAVSAVKPADFAGYVAVAGDTTLDMITEVPEDYEVSVDDLAQGPATTDVTVYEKDTNGNYISVVDSANVVLEGASGKYVTVSEGSVTVEAKKVGSEAVTVKVGTATVGKITFKVVDSTPVATTFKQLKGAFTLTGEEADVFATLFTEDGKAFSAKDQYGRSIAITTDDVTVYSSDKNVVSVDADGVITVVGPGTTTLTVIADKVYTVTVNVPEAE